MGHRQIDKEVAKVEGASSPGTGDTHSTYSHVRSCGHQPFHQPCDHPPNQPSDHLPDHQRALRVHPLINRKRCLAKPTRTRKSSQRRSQPASSVPSPPGKGKLASASTPLASMSMQSHGVLIHSDSQTPKLMSIMLEMSSKHARINLSRQGKKVAAAARQPIAESKVSEYAPVAKQQMVSTRGSQDQNHAWRPQH